MSEALNTVAWFEIATGDPEGAQRFYGELFGWSFAADPANAADGVDYRLISYPGSDGPAGAVFGTGGQQPPHAIFVVAVADVAETAERVKRLGGEIVTQSVGQGNAPDFAYLRDPAGNLFGVFQPQ